VVSSNLSQGAILPNEPSKLYSKDGLFYLILVIQYFALPYHLSAGWTNIVIGTYSGGRSGCSFSKNDFGPPWGGPIFSTGGIIYTMFQNIFIGGAHVEVAHAVTIVLMKEAHVEWLADHPDWTPTGN
jgi:hypothetical protein